MNVDHLKRAAKKLGELTRMTGLLEKETKTQEIWREETSAADVKNVFQKVFDVVTYELKEHS